MTLRITRMLSKWEIVKSAYVQNILIYFILAQLSYKWLWPGKTFPMISHLTSYLTYFILAQKGYKWLGPGKTFPMVSHLTSCLTYLLRYDTQNHPHVKSPLEFIKSSHVQNIFILAQLGYKWLGPDKTFPMISHWTSYLAHLLRYDTQILLHVIPMGNCQVRLCPKYILL